MFVFIVICFLIAGCSPSTQEPTQAYVTVLVQTLGHTKPTIDQFETACERVQTRLSILLDPDPEVSISEGGLRITAFDSEDTIAMIKASIEIGSYQFFDSEVPLQIGSIAPEDARVIITSENISHAEAVSTEKGGWQVRINLDEEGSERLAEYSTQNLYHYLIIAKDSQVISSPPLAYALLDGRVNIVGFEQQAAKTFAAHLESGSLPLSLALATEP
jgi:preprotein translocase subunit SecD